MQYTQEIKHAFIERMREHNIIIVSHWYGKTSASFEHKIIGMRNGLRWDFTGLVADLTGCKTNNACVASLAVRGYADEIIKSALAALKEQGYTDAQDFMESPRDFYGQFYM